MPDKGISRRVSLIFNALDISLEIKQEDIYKYLQKKHLGHDHGRCVQQCWGKAAAPGKRSTTGMLR